MILLEKSTSIIFSIDTLSSLKNIRNWNIFLINILGVPREHRFQTKISMISWCQSILYIFIVNSNQFDLKHKTCWSDVYWILKFGTSRFIAAGLPDPQRFYILHFTCTNILFKSKKEIKYFQLQQKLKKINMKKN